MGGKNAGGSVTRSENKQSKQHSKQQQQQKTLQHQQQQQNQHNNPAQKQPQKQQQQQQQQSISQSSHQYPQQQHQQQPSEAQQQKQQSSPISSSSSSSAPGSTSRGYTKGGSSSQYFSPKAADPRSCYTSLDPLRGTAKAYGVVSCGGGNNTDNSAPSSGNSNSENSRIALQLEIKRRASMASVVLKSLSILLGIFFIFVGTTKLTPRVSRELYKDLRKEFARYAKVFPLAQALELKIPSKWYRRSVGALEILCGICLTFIPSQRVKQTANLTLVLMMLFATYNHWMVGDKFERIAPSLVFFFMLTCRLIVEYQIKRKEKLEEKEKADKDAKQQQQPVQPQQNPQPQQQQASSASGKSSTGKEARLQSGASGKAKKED